MSGRDEPAPPLGAVVDEGGVTFSLLSESAEAVALCLFAAPGDAAETRRVALERGPGGVWSGRVAGTGPGQLYGYRVDGPYDPRQGHHFDPAKLLIDPWALAVTGEPRYEASLFARPGDPGGKGPGDPGGEGPGSDTAGAMPKAIVVAAAEGTPRPARPATPWRETVIYECHVKGMTRLHPEVPEASRGTYAGLGHPAVIAHLRGLGVTAVELLPVQQFASEPTLVRAGLSNYFGYNPMAMFAPHAGWATGADGRQVDEFRQMVDAFHEAGIEVLLDVVFNHTAEGGADGPTLSWRGIDNWAYYRLDAADSRRYVNWSGCGNTLDTASPAGRRLVLDCLRHWVGAMGVDGFRFDLAPTLGRDRAGRFRPAGSLIEEIAADPALAGIKLIAEPWDLGPKGYGLGRFPEPWREWNDHYRDAVRRFWRGEGGRRSDLASALAGSPALFGGERTRPVSIDFVTSHDGFTLADLVTYEHKRNETNLENNRDGNDGNHSRNWGVEGPSDSPAIRDLRDRVRRGLMASLALTAGVPMLAHGDELGRTQLGNNNAYCHDGPLTWVDWELDDDGAAFLDFTRALFRLRRELALGAGTELTWLRPDGTPMRPIDWRPHAAGALAVLLSASGGELLAAINGSDREVLFQLPPLPDGARWRRRLSTARPEAPHQPPRLRSLRLRSLRLLPHSLVLLGRDQDAGAAAAGANSTNS